MEFAPTINRNVIAANFAFAIGLSAFLLVVGARALNPSNIDWLWEGDAATHYLGWLFFRHSNWSFPLGLNPDYGLEIGNSILFSDSNPLLAIALKPFSQWLPEPFQYFGLWFLACFVFQAWFGWKLIGLATSNLVVLAAGSALFAFAPPMIWRFGSHPNLAGHFLILAGLYIALNRHLTGKAFYWRLLLPAAALVHAYLLAMVAAIWLADLAGRPSRSEGKTKLFMELFSTAAITGFFCWQAGYFSVGDGVASGGYGFYRMNLLSLVDASGWSYVFKDIPEAGGDYEGFNYLGLGFIFLGICALPIIFSGGAILRWARGYPTLLATLSLLALFAVTNNIGFGGNSFEFPLPGGLLEIANVFRSSGRIFWPVYYAVALAIVVLVIRGHEPRVAGALLVLALLLQISDTHAGWTKIRERLTNESGSGWNSFHFDPFWDIAAKKYAKVRWILPGNKTPQWRALAIYAGRHGLATDAVYLARVDRSAMDLIGNKALQSLETGKYEADALYFLDESLIGRAAASLSNSDALARIDGFLILAPGWRKCVECPELKEIDALKRERCIEAPCP